MMLEQCVAVQVIGVKSFIGIASVTPAGDMRIFMTLA